MGEKSSGCDIAHLQGANRDHLVPVNIYPADIRKSTFGQMSVSQIVVGVLASTGPCFLDCRGPYER
jgi:hypothetical protein